MVSACNHKCKLCPLVIIAKTFDAFVLIQQTFLYMLYIKVKRPFAVVYTHSLLTMPVPIPLGNWRHHIRNAHIQVSAQLQTESGQWTLQTVYVRPDESGVFCGLFDNMDGCFVEGSNDSWSQSAKKTC